MEERINSEQGHISAVVFQEGNWWSAQCLEYDLAAQARTVSDLRYELQRVIATHVAASRELGEAPFVSLKPAPQSVFEKGRWLHGHRLMSVAVAAIVMRVSATAVSCS